MHSLDEALALTTAPDRVARGAPIEHAAVYAIWERLDARMVAPDFEKNLTPAERAYHLIFFVLDGEASNGGLHQFFFNSSGDHTTEIAEGLRTIGAAKTLSVFERAIAAFPEGGPPADIDERREVLEGGAAADAIAVALDGLTDEYYRVHSEIYACLLAFVRSHREEFPSPDAETIQRIERNSPSKRRKKRP